MYLVLGIFLLMDLIILTAWQIIDPLYLDIERFPLETPKVADKDIQYEPQLEYCTSQYLNIWLGEHKRFLFKRGNLNTLGNLSLLY